MSSYDDLELRATRMQATRQSSMCMLSRVETTMMVMSDTAEGSTKRKSMVNQHLHNHNGCSHSTKRSTTYTPSNPHDDFC